LLLVVGQKSILARALFPLDPVQEGPAGIQPVKAFIPSLASPAAKGAAPALPSEGKSSLCNTATANQQPLRCRSKKADPVVGLSVLLLQRDSVGLMVAMKSKVLHVLMVVITGAVLQGAMWTDTRPDDPSAAVGNRVLHSVENGLLEALSA
jgi:hypothetical protein